MDQKKKYGKLIFTKNPGKYLNGFSPWYLSLNDFFGDQSLI
jgi:hypothetical protein